MMTVDEVEKLNNYIWSVKPEVLAKGMGWPYKETVQIAWADDKFVQMRTNFLDFFTKLDSISQALFLALAVPTQKKLTGPKGSYIYEGEADLNGIHVDLIVGYKIEHDSDYGADRDGNRGIAVSNVADEEVYVAKNGTYIHPYLSSDDQKDLDRVIERLQDKFMENARS